MFLGDVVASMDLGDRHRFGTARAAPVTAWPGTDSAGTDLAQHVLAR